MEYIFKHGKNRTSILAKNQKEARKKFETNVGEKNFELVRLSSPGRNAMPKVLRGTVKLPHNCKAGCQRVVPGCASKCRV